MPAKCSDRFCVGRHFRRTVGAAPQRLLLRQQASIGVGDIGREKEGGGASGGEGEGEREKIKNGEGGGVSARRPVASSSTIRAIHQ